MKRITILSILVLASLACSMQSQIVREIPTTLTATSSPVTATRFPEFTVSFDLVNYRDLTGNVVGQKHKGDSIPCALFKSGWCQWDDYKIWAGCLEPNPQEKECK